MLTGGLLNLFFLPVIFLSVVFISGGMLFLFIRKPFICLVLLVFCIPLEDLVPLFTSFSLTKLFGIIALIAYLFNRLSNKTLLTKIRIDSFSIGMMIFALWAGLSYLWSVGGSESDYIMRLVTILLLIGTYLLMINLCDTMIKVKTLLWAFVVSMFTSFFVVGTYLISDPLMFYGVKRITAGAQNTNTLGSLCAISVIIAVYLYFEEKILYKKIFAGVILISSFGFLAISLSRGNWLAFMAALVFACISLRKRLISWKALVFACGIILLIGVATLTLKNYGLDVQRMVNMRIQRTDEASINRNRVAIWKTGLRIVQDNWLLGIGIDNFSNRFGDYVDWMEYQKVGMSGHNDYLTVMAELGLVGFLIFSYLIFLLIRSAMKIEAFNDRVFFMAFGICILVSAFFLGILYRKAIWLYFALVSVSASINCRGKSSG